jgi:hypothetical protein
VDVGKQSRKMSAQTSALLMKVKVLSKAVKVLHFLCSQLAFATVC